MGSGVRPLPPLWVSNPIAHCCFLFFFFLLFFPSSLLSSPFLSFPFFPSTLKMAGSCALHQFCLTRVLSWGSAKRRAFFFRDQQWLWLWVGLESWFGREPYSPTVSQENGSSYSFGTTTVLVSTAGCSFSSWNHSLLFYSVRNDRIESCGIMVIGRGEQLDILKPIAPEEQTMNA